MSVLFTMFLEITGLRLSSSLKTLNCIILEVADWVTVRSTS